MKKKLKSLIITFLKKSYLTKYLLITLLYFVIIHIAILHSPFNPFMVMPAGVTGLDTWGEKVLFILLSFYFITLLLVIEISIKLREKELDE